MKAGQGHQIRSENELSNEEVPRIEIVIHVAKDPSIEWKDSDALEGKSVPGIRGFTHGDKFEPVSGIRNHGIGFLKQGFALIDKNRELGFVGMPQCNDCRLKVLVLSDKYKK